MRAVIPALALGIVPGLGWSPDIDAAQSAVVDLAAARARLSPAARALVDRHVYKLLSENDVISGAALCGTPNSPTGTRPER
jgi:hypothetical protein